MSAFDAIDHDSLGNVTGGFFPGDGGCVPPRPVPLPKPPRTDWPLPHPPAGEWPRPTPPDGGGKL